MRRGDLLRAAANIEKSNGARVLVTRCSSTTAFDRAANMLLIYGSHLHDNQPDKDLGTQRPPLGLDSRRAGLDERMWALKRFFSS